MSNEQELSTTPDIDISTIAARQEAVGVFGRILSLGESPVARTAAVLAATWALAACGPKASEPDNSGSATTSTSQGESSSNTPSASSSTNGSEQGSSSSTAPSNENTPGTGTSTPSASPAETHAPAEKLVGHIDVSNLGPRAAKKAEALAKNPSETSADWQITDEDIDQENFAESYAQAEFVVEAALLASVTGPTAYKQFLANKPAGMTGQEFPEWAYKNLYLPKMKAAYGAAGTTGVELGMIAFVKAIAQRADVLNHPSENAMEMTGKKYGPYTYILKFDPDSVKPEGDKVGWSSNFRETISDWTDMAIYLSLSSPEIQGKPVNQTIIMPPRTIREWPDGSYAAVPAKK